MSDNLTRKLKGCAFLAYPEMSGMLKTELSGRLGFDSKPTAQYGDLIYYEDFVPSDVNNPDSFPYWSRCTMLEPEIIQFKSIGEAAASLKNIHYPA